MIRFAPRFIERWWHFGRCVNCRHRYSDWFVTGKCERYCYPCSSQRSRAAATQETR